MGEVRLARKWYEFYQSVAWVPRGFGFISDVSQTIRKKFSFGTKYQEKEKGRRGLGEGKLISIMTIVIY